MASQALDALRSETNKIHLNINDQPVIFDLDDEKLEELQMLMRLLHVDISSIDGFEQRGSCCSIVAILSYQQFSDAAVAHGAHVTDVGVGFLWQKMELLVWIGVEVVFHHNYENCALPFWNKQENEKNMVSFPQSRTTLPGLEAPVHISTQRSSEVSSVSPPSKAVKFRTHMPQQKQQGVHVTHHDACSTERFQAKPCRSNSV